MSELHDAPLIDGRAVQTSAAPSRFVYSRFGQRRFVPKGFSARKTFIEDPSLAIRHSELLRGVNFVVAASAGAGCV